MFGSRKSKFEHFLTAGLPILLAVLANLFLVFKQFCISGGPYFTAILGMNCFGILLLIFAKLPNFKIGIYQSFGWKLLDRQHRVIYFLGYFLIITSLTFAVV